MMSVEQQAKALADWLAENPGAEPPEGVDADVIEAVYSLRPDLAPAPRVSIDDILGMVSSGPLAAPVAPVEAPVVPTEASDVPVSSVPDAVVTPTPANNNRRLWAVLGGVAALAAAVLVTVQVSVNAGQVPYAPEASAPERETRAPQIAQAPAMDMAPGAARQQDKAIDEVEQPEALDADGVFDAVADLGYIGGEGGFERDNEFGGGAEFAELQEDESDEDARLGGLLAAEPEREPNDSSGRERGLAWDAGEALDGDLDNFGSVGVSGGLTTGSGEAALDRNESRVTARPRPAPTPAPEPAMAPQPARPTSTIAANSPPPPPVEPSVVSTDSAGADDFWDAAVADVDLEEEEAQVEELAGRSFDDEVMDLETVVVSESMSTRRDRGGRRPRRGAAAPSVDVPQQQPAEPAEQEPHVDAAPAAGAAQRQLSSLQGGADAGVAQAQQRARALADQQQYSSAFDMLSGYISPSAPVQVVLDATEYAFAAGRWSDTIRVASIRLNANVPSDSSQQRSRLYDYRARAQAMLDDGPSRPSMMSAPD